jgi:hypothetical protein
LPEEQSTLGIHHDTMGKISGEWNEKNRKPSPPAPFRSRLVQPEELLRPGCGHVQGEIGAGDDGLIVMGSNLPPRLAETH